VEGYLDTADCLDSRQFILAVKRLRKSAPDISRNSDKMDEISHNMLKRVSVLGRL